MAIVYRDLAGVALRCNHFEETLAFYTQALGLDKAYEVPGEDGAPAMVAVRAGEGQMIELHRAAYGSPNRTRERSFHHLCLEVDHYTETIRDLQRRGVTVYESIVDLGVVCDEPLERYTAGQCGSYGAFVRDPEGNDIELQMFTENSLQLK